MSGRDADPGSPAPGGPLTPTGAVIVELCCVSDIGLVRERNEDAFLALPVGQDARLEAERSHRVQLGEAGLLLAVFDGMGGAASGDLASLTAVEMVARGLGASAAPERGGSGALDKTSVAANRLYRALRAANYQIKRISRRDESCAGMGTTVAAALVLDSGRVVLLNVGDSRAYVLRQGKLTQVTEDQSLTNELIAQGEIDRQEAQQLEYNNVILQALGIADELEPSVTSVDLRGGDRLMLCSDGLTDMVGDDEIEVALQQAQGPVSGSKALVGLAKEKGGVDNVTVLAAWVSGEGLAAADGPAVELRPLRIPSLAAALRRRTIVRYVSYVAGALALMLVIAAMIVLLGTSS